MTSSHNNALNESHDYDYLDPDVFKHTIESSCTYSSDFIQHPTENKNNAFQSEINDITEDLSLDLSGATTCTQSGVSKKESKVHFEDSISSKKSRKYKEETLFLNKYLSKNKSRVKKEYLRVFFIRGIKKI